MSLGPDLILLGPNLILLGPDLFLLVTNLIILGLDLFLSKALYPATVLAQAFNAARSVWRLR